MGVVSPRPSLRLLSAVLSALLATSPLTVAAAEPPAASAEDPAAQFELAEQYYRDGRYEDAAAILAALAETIPDPILFYNLGRAYESAGQLRPAVDAYKRYLEVAPDAKDADAVSARVGRLEERVAQQEEEAARAEAEPAAPPPPVVTPQTTDELEQPRPAVAPWVLLGVGGVGVIAGAAVAGVAASKHQDAKDEPVQSKAATLDDDAQGLALAGNVTMAVGGALALAGLTWGIVRLVQQRKRSDVAWTPGGLRF